MIDTGPRAYGVGDQLRDKLGLGTDNSFVKVLQNAINFHLKDFRVRRQPYMLGLLIEGTAVGAGFLPVKSIFDRFPVPAPSQ